MRTADCLNPPQIPGMKVVMAPEYILNEYKMEIFDLYDKELLTFIVELKDNRFSALTGSISEKVMQVRSMVLLGEGDSVTDWLDIGTRFLLLQKKAEELGCREVYGRASVLVFRVSQLIQKMKRLEAGAR